jgi:hypothetical protein
VSGSLFYSRIRRIGCAIALLGAGASSPLFAQTKPSPEIKWDAMDLGSFHSGTFKVAEQIVAKGIAIKLGTAAAPATILFDPELLRVSAAWTGGFIRFPRGRGGLEGQISLEGTIAFSSAYAPGWASGEIGADPRDNHQGHLPAAAGRWKGLFTHGDRVILRYLAGTAEILELPGAEMRGKGTTVFTRTFRVSKTTAPLTLLIADVAGGVGAVDARIARLTVRNSAGAGGDRTTVAALASPPAGSKLDLGANGRLTVRLPPLPTGALFQVAVASGRTADVPSNAEMQKPSALVDPQTLTKGGPARWNAAIETRGKLGDETEQYAADEIVLPEDNPFHSWLRPGGHDFFANGSAALVNLSGDVWIVSGLDEKLEHVKWRRFATGLFQPLGCKIVDGKIYVLGRDQITRLHDLNNDGEADFYENFNNDCVVTDNYHEFALDLQTDSKGNFYYAKGSPWTPTNTSPHQGCLLKVSADGSNLEVIATGLRAPNGVGIGPHDEITVSDNEGHWVPADRLNLVKQGGFYGMTPAAHRTLTFKANDGAEFQADPSDAAARAKFKTEFWGKPTDPKPTTHDLPLCWIPKPIDNSSGSQVWVPPGDRWGPFAGKMLLLSYGKCALFSVMMERVGDQTQGGVCRFPLKFNSGIMRARFNPRDGQLYVSGLNVWQSSAAKDGCFYRVRYTGKAATVPLELHTTKQGVAITFNRPLDPQAATDAQNFSVERWNYAWTGAYGSPDISVANPKQRGRDLVFIDKLQLSADKRTLLIALPDMAPVMQMRIRYKFPDAEGAIVNQEIYSTINRLPET